MSLGWGLRTSLGSTLKILADTWPGLSREQQEKGQQHRQAVNGLVWAAVLDET